MEGGIPGTGILPGMQRIVNISAGRLERNEKDAMDSGLSGSKAHIKGAGEYNELSGYIWGQWQSREDSYIQAMKLVVFQTVTKVEPRDGFQTQCRGVSTSCTTFPVHWTGTYSTYGDKLAEWMSSNKSSAYLKGNVPSHDARTKKTGDTSAGTGGGGGCSCFVPGTLVYTKTGSVPIEKLSEGDYVLTNSGTKEYGIVSDERVRISTGSREARTTVYGFNDGEAFFTANHVFYTTTGLRAINPYEAMKENPWLNVGRL